MLLILSQFGLQMMIGNWTTLRYFSRAVGEMISEESGNPDWQSPVAAVGRR